MSYSSYATVSLTASYEAARQPVTPDSTSRHSQASPKLSVRMRRVLIFAMTSFVYFLNWSCTSMWTPFFPGEAGKRGVSSTEVGFIFGTYNLVAFLSSLVYGPFLIPAIGPYFILFAGLFVNGGVNVLCSFIYLITNKHIFSTYCFLVRAMGALGGAACETAIVVILTNEFKDHLTTVIGTLEVFTGLGFIVGPVLGGVLYSLGGFRLPFIAIGGLLLVSLPFIWCLLPRKEHPPTTTSSSHAIRKVFTMPAMLVMCSTCLILPISMSSIDPILQPYAKTFGLGSTGVALLFVCTSGTYIVSSPLTGRILNKKPWGRTFMVIGSIGSCVCVLFFGPAPFLESLIPPKTTWILFLSFMFCGAAFALAYIPILPEIIQILHERGLPKGLRTDSLASGLYTASCNLGNFIGPVLGGSLNDSMGFAWTCTVVACILAWQAAILAVFFMCNRRRPSASSTDAEHQMLLSEDKTETYL